MSARRSAACGALLAIGLAVAGSFEARVAADPSSGSSASPSASGPKQILVPLEGKSFKNMAAPVLGADELNAPVLDYYAPIGSADGAETTVEGEGKTTTTLSSDVNFEVDSANLTPRAREVLDGLVSKWRKKKPKEISITGHTDSVADDDHNQKLSEDRAKAVRSYVAPKVSGVSIEVEGKGEKEPVASETNEDGSPSEAGKAANRRVVIVSK